MSKRRPIWSDRLTRPLAARIPDERRPAALRAIRLVHTAAFAGIAAAIAVVDWDAARGRPGTRTALAMGVAVAESVVFVTNDGVCPLTPLAEELGAASGSVTDLYLPKALSDRIPLIGGLALALGLVMLARAARRGERTARA